MSEYLSDQGKRTHLLDYLASIYASVADLATVLMELERGKYSEAEQEALHFTATTHAMDILADWKSVGPMLVDIYKDNDPVLDG